MNSANQKSDSIEITNNSNQIGGKHTTGFFIIADSYINDQDALKYKKLIYEKLGYKTTIIKVNKDQELFFRVVLEKTVANRSEGEIIINQLKINKLAADPWLRSF